MSKKRLFDLPIYDGELKPKLPHSIARCRQFLGYYDHIERTEGIRAVLCCDDGRNYVVSPKFAFIEGDRLEVLYPHIKIRRKGILNSVVYLDENGDTLQTREDKFNLRQGDIIIPNYYIHP